MMIPGFKIPPLKNIPVNNALKETNKETNEENPAPQQEKPAFFMKPLNLGFALPKENKENNNKETKIEENDNDEEDEDEDEEPEKLEISQPPPLEKPQSLEKPAFKFSLNIASLAHNQVGTTTLPDDHPAQKEKEKEKEKEKKKEKENKKLDIFENDDDDKAEKKGQPVPFLRIPGFVDNKEKKRQEALQVPIPNVISPPATGTTRDGQLAPRQNQEEQRFFEKELSSSSQKTCKIGLLLPCFCEYDMTKKEFFNFKQDIKNEDSELSKGIKELIKANWKFTKPAEYLEEAKRIMQKNQANPIASPNGTTTPPPPSTTTPTDPNNPQQPQSATTPNQNPNANQEEEFDLLAIQPLYPSKKGKRKRSIDGEDGGDDEAIDEKSGEVVEGLERLQEGEEGEYDYSVVCIPQKSNLSVQMMGHVFEENTKLKIKLDKCLETIKYLQDENDQLKELTKMPREEIAKLKNRIVKHEHLRAEMIKTVDALKRQHVLLTAAIKAQQTQQLKNPQNDS